MDYPSKVPASAFQKTFTIERMGVSKASGASRLAAPWLSVLNESEIERPDAFDIAKKRINKIGGRLQLIKGKYTAVFQRESALALRIQILNSKNFRNYEKRN